MFVENHTIDKEDAYQILSSLRSDGKIILYGANPEVTERFYTIMALLTHLKLIQCKEQACNWEYLLTPGGYAWLGIYEQDLTHPPILEVDLSRKIHRLSECRLEKYLKSEI